MISTSNSLYMGFSNHQIIMFINFLSLILLLFMGLMMFRLLSLSFFLSLIYSVAMMITFIFLMMILDQSEILLRENYKFIPLGLYIMLGVTAYLAYSIWHVLSGHAISISSWVDSNQSNSKLTFPYNYIMMSSAMGKTSKVNKRFSFANNLILENDLSLLSGSLYTDMNGMVFMLGLGLFISLVNGMFLLQLTKEMVWWLKEYLYFLGSSWG